MTSNNKAMRPIVIALLATTAIGAAGLGYLVLRGRRAGHGLKTEAVIALVRQ